MSCDDLVRALAAGDPPGPEGDAHLEACPACARASRVVTLARIPAPVSGPPPQPDAHRFQRRLVAARARRAGLLALAATLVAAFLSDLPTESAPSPDLFALLGDADRALQSSPDAVPGTEALVLLDPWRAPWSAETGFPPLQGENP